MAKEYQPTITYLNEQDKPLLASTDPIELISNEPRLDLTYPYLKGGGILMGTGEQTLDLFVNGPEFSRVIIFDRNVVRLSLINYYFQTLSDVLRVARSSDQADSVAELFYHSLTVDPKKAEKKKIDRNLIDSLDASQVPGLDRNGMSFVEIQFRSRASMKRYKSWLKPGNLEKVIEADMDNRITLVAVDLTDKTAGKSLSGMIGQEEISTLYLSNICSYHSICDVSTKTPQTYINNIANLPLLKEASIISTHNGRFDDGQKFEGVGFEIEGKSPGDLDYLYVVESRDSFFQRRVAKDVGLTINTPKKYSLPQPGLMVAL